MISIVAAGGASLTPLAHAEREDWGTPSMVFEDIFLVFLVLGTLVGGVVIFYMLWNAYRYREGVSPSEDFDAPTLGELPTGGKGGKKLFLSFFISAIIVISLVAWTYVALLHVEAGAASEIETEYDVEIEAVQFGWDVTYPNDQTSFNNIFIPVDTDVNLAVTSADVWHTFGVTDLRVKADAIPGQTANAWVLAEEETGSDYHLVECFELCGAGHSGMHGFVYVIDADLWESAFVEEDGEGTDEFDIEDLDGGEN